MIENIISAIFANGKGILAMDESNPTCNRRFGKLGIPQTEEARREYRELILTTPRLSESIGGVILYDETFHQKKSDGTSFLDLIREQGMMIGIKVDTGAKPLAGHPLEKVTEGLDQLRKRLSAYAEQGAKFAKWRGVISVSAELPSQACIQANAHALARYAALCQEAGILPIIEPEVIMDGEHSLEDSSRVTEQVLHAVFSELFTQGIKLESIILKPNMVMPGLSSKQVASVDQVADATLECLRRVVPIAVPAVAFLSGGQSAQAATEHLSAMNSKSKGQLPWAVAFSYARAIQQPALEIWRGQSTNAHEAQQALVHRAECNRAARLGNYNDAYENRQCV